METIELSKPIQNISSGKVSITTCSSRNIPNLEHPKDSQYLGICVSLVEASPENSERVNYSENQPKKPKDCKHDATTLLH